MDWRPDVIHAHVFEAGVPAVLLGRRLGVPVVVSEHFTAFQRGLVHGLDLRLARYTFAHAELVCPVSEDLRAQLELVQPRGRYRVVGNVVDPSIFFPPSAPRAPGPLRLFNVASLDEKKRHMDLLEAFAALRVDATLEIAGEGELDEKLQRRAHVLGLSERVTFLGSLGQAEIAARMREADMFVLSSRFENLPVVLLEASATGLPIVATRVGGVPEIVGADGGALVEPLSPEALARAIEDVAERSFDREALAARARSRWGIEAIGATWDEIYASLSAGSTRASSVR
jgi:glycosyltransferase involved in cell wall biosynthesis